MRPLIAFTDSVAFSEGRLAAWIGRIMRQLAEALLDVHFRQRYARRDATCAGQEPQLLQVSRSCASDAAVCPLKWAASGDQCVAPKDYKVTLLCALRVGI